MLIDDLKLKKKDIYNISSLKEQAFYQFLVGDPMSCPTHNDLVENVQICLSVFCINAPSKKDLIEKHRKTQPKKGMHYTTNLIDLCAMAKNNVEQERDNLMSYCQNNSTRDFYILKHLFPGIFPHPSVPQGNIDQIALHLYEGSFPQEDWKPLLLNALYETSDLIDFYVVEQGYQKAMDDNPLLHRIKEIEYVTDVLDYVVEKTERRVKFVFKLICTFFAILISAASIYFIALYWGKVEPLISVFSILFGLTAFLCLLYTGYAPDKRKIINTLREEIADFVFKLKGLNRSELKEILKSLENKDRKHR